MKYLSVFKITNPEYIKAAEKKRNELPDFGITPISESYGIVGQLKGFQIIEAEDEKALEKFAFYYLPEVKFKFKPIIEVKEISKIIS
ncbi:MAG: DUF3303 domain-containing protein [Candidatus Thorarchaeota archaeon]